MKSNISTLHFLTTNTSALAGTLATASPIGLVKKAELAKRLSVCTQITAGSAKGSLAWWIGGENQKARLPKPYKPANDTIAGWSIRRDAPQHRIEDLTMPPWKHIHS